MNDHDDPNQLPPRDDADQGPAMAALDARLAALNPEVAPPAETWSAIEARLKPHRHGGGSGGWSGFGPGASLALAASLAALALALTLTLGRPGEGPGTIVQTDPRPEVSTSENTLGGIGAFDTGMPAIMPASLGGKDALGEEFLASRAAMRDQFLQRINELDPRSRELVVTNMQVIEAALGRISAALEDNPENALLRDLLVSTYQQELTYMGRITRPVQGDRSRISI